MNSRFDKLGKETQKKFKKVDQRFNNIDKKFEGIDSRFDKQEQNHNKLALSHVNLTARVDEMKEKMETLLTRSEFVSSMDIVMGKLDSIIQENVCFREQYKRHDHLLINHETRIKVLETAK